MDCNNVVIIVNGCKIEFKSDNDKKVIIIEGDKFNCNEKGSIINDIEPENRSSENTFENEQQKGKVWKGGTWEGGTWVNGAWKKGIWKKGIWENGIWKGGVWLDGVWVGGIWKGGFWESGTWINGTWEGGYDKYGNYHPDGDSPDKWNI